MYSFGDIIIINSPFSDNQGSKRRPAVVIKDTNDKDLLIAKVTSQSYYTEFDITIKEWKQAGLISASVIRTHKIQTIYNSLIFSAIGRLTPVDLQLVRRGLLDLVTDL